MISESENILILDEANFKETIREGITLVDFWAPWCMPCRLMEPAVERIAEKMTGKAKVGKVNIDENPKISEEYKIMSIPLVLIFKDGEVVGQLFGVRSETELLEAIFAVI